MRRLAAVILLLPALAGSSAWAAPPAPPSAGRSVVALARLRVAAPGPRSGYTRAKFGGWDSVGDRCDTREEVLRRDGSHVMTDAQCHPIAGRWRSYYDGTIIRSSSKLDIDHVVPLANAWISGARTWTAARRDAFANDLDDPQLIAVSASSNRSKGDRSPDEWRPPLRSSWCSYARWWVDVKSTWKLTITAPEHDALAAMLGTC
ncbi:HNH endonuclease family protein [Candidatus Solirubrobacter pratensis]|uniref:HNH endonuclease family protein n=1 Tax=Candidatus Solirubrobacter pratensis TaxID=1298857 RepID=UPI0004183AE1|nr:HNH endonuclease family protein [Candidatus Solirubrobacter pratensis]